MVHALDLWRVASVQPGSSQGVAGRVSPALPESGRVGLIPDHPGHGEPFPIGLELKAKVKNHHGNKVFLDIGCSVDAVLLAGSMEHVPVSGTEMNVRIESVDWIRDPAKPSITVAAASSTARLAPDRPGADERRAITFLLDGSNLLQHTGAASGLGGVRAVETLLRALVPDARIHCIYDRSVLSFLDGRATSELGAAQLSGEAMVCFEGVEADTVLLAAARQLGAIVVSNDHFSDHGQEREGLPVLEVQDPQGRLRLGRVRVSKGTESIRDCTLEEFLVKSDRPGRVRAGSPGPGARA